MRKKNIFFILSYFLISICIPVILRKTPVTSKSSLVLLRSFFITLSLFPNVSSFFLCIIFSCKLYKYEWYVMSVILFGHICSHCWSIVFSIMLSEKSHPAIDVLYKWKCWPAHMSLFTIVDYWHNKRQNIWLLPNLPQLWIRSPIG